MAGAGESLAGAALLVWGPELGEAREELPPEGAVAQGLSRSGVHAPSAGDSDTRGRTLGSEPLLTGLTSLDWQPVSAQVLGQMAQGQASESGH